MLNIKTQRFSLKIRLTLTMLLTLLPLALAALFGYAILHRTVVRDFVDASYRQKEILLPLRNLQLLVLQMDIPLEEYIETGSAEKYNQFQFRRQEVEKHFPPLFNLLEGENNALLRRAMDDWNLLEMESIELLAAHDSGNDTAFLASQSRFDNIQASAHDKLEALVGLLEEDIEADYLDASLGLERSQWIAGISGAIALLITGFGIFYFNRTILNGVERLIQGAERFANGDREHKIEIQIPPELHRVAEEFNKMIGIIRVSEDKLNEMARRDNLTGLLNRLSYEEAIAEAFARRKRLGESLAMLSLDIDFFKKVNDTYGHDVGDIVLRYVAGVLQDSVRSIDKVFRLGGEEFTILLPSTTADAAKSMAERIRRNIEQGEVINANHTLKVTVSLGIASPVNDETPETLAKHADLALYRAKQSGRNRVVMFDGDTGDDVV